MRLFCFPPAGGSASLFRLWREHLPEPIDIYAAQLPGREGRVHEAPIRSMRELSERLAAALQPHLDRPFAVFGHSMGGLLGFEVARILARSGAVPEHLFVSAVRPPDIPDRDHHHLLPDEQLIAELRTMGGFSEQVLRSKELMEVLLPMIRADAAVTETYSFSEGAALECPITALYGTDDPKATSEEVDGWASHTRRLFAKAGCPGGHDFLLTSTAHVVAHIVDALRPLRDESRPPHVLSGS